MNIFIPRGIANIIPSNLSSKPPWPGKKFPVSLIFAFLFKYEINKSPNCETNDINKVKNIKLIEKLK